MFSARRLFRDLRARCRAGAARLARARGTLTRDESIRGRTSPHLGIVRMANKADSPIPFVRMDLVCI